MQALRRFLSAALLWSAPTLLAQVYFNGQGRMTAPPSNSKPEDRCVLQGRVTNAVTGEPVRKASLRLVRQMQATNVEPGTMPQQQGYATTAGPDGTFTIENIEPGDYHLSGDRFGFLNSNYGAKNYGERGTTISLRPGQQMTNINFAMTPQAVIAGKVVDQDGDPVPNVQISLIGEMWQRGKLTHQMQNGSGTNDLGEFRLANIRPGKYYLLAQQPHYPGEPGSGVENGKPEIEPVRTYYPDATTLQSATALDMKAGQDLTGMDIRMRTAATFHIRGKVVGLLPEGANMNRLNVSATARDDSEMMPWMGQSSAVMMKDRSFDLAGVAPGEYSVNLLGNGGPMRVMGRTEVEVGQADVNDVEVMIQQPGTVHGKISFEGNPPAGTTPANMSNVRVFLTSTEGRMMMGNNQARPGDDGSFAIENVMPGKYYVQANAPRGTYLQSMRLGNQEMVGKAIDLSSGSGQITLVYSYGVAEVDGTVQFPQSSSGANASATPDVSIVLVPEKMNEDGSGIHMGNSGAGGSFTVKNVPPGRYKAYAFEKFEYGSLQNPDVQRELASRGVDVELKASDRTQVQLNLISEEELNQVFSKLGMEVSH